jgi:bacterioferritin
MTNEQEEQMNDKQVVIDILNADLRDEHAAIVQYLQHAYAIGEGEEASEIEAIAREEMRHLDWLAEAIVELGGKPDMERGVVDLSGSGPVEWMARDIIAEEKAIAQYKEHIAAIDDPKIKRLLRRILSDEESHRDEFADLSDELAEEGAEASGPLEARSAEGAVPQVVDILQQGVRHEYSVILQYLYHNFVMPQCEIGRELEMQAINEMQHLGWLAEEVAELGGHPLIERTELALEGTAEEMLQADIDAERAVTMDYNQQIPLLEDEGLKKLLVRIRDHEVYHDEVFSDLLAEVQVEGKEPEVTAEPEIEAEPAPEPPPGPLGRLTVGSLLKAEKQNEEG